MFIALIKFLSLENYVMVSISRPDESMLIAKTLLLSDVSILEILLSIAPTVSVTVTKSWLDL